MPKPVLDYHLDGTPVKNPRATRTGDVTSMTYTSAWESERLVTTVTGGQPGQREIRFLDHDEMYDRVDADGVGPMYARILSWRKRQ